MQITAYTPLLTLSSMSLLMCMYNLHVPALHINPLSWAQFHYIFAFEIARADYYFIN